MKGEFGFSTYNLELNREETEVDNLHCRPNQVVCFECGNIDVLELAGNSALTTALGNGHKGKEASQTWR